jgi:hypothetical protein
MAESDVFGGDTELAILHAHVNEIPLTDVEQLNEQPANAHTQSVPLEQHSTKNPAILNIWHRIQRSEEKETETISSPVDCISPIAPISSRNQSINYSIDFLDDNLLVAGDTSHILHNVGEEDLVSIINEAHNNSIPQWYLERVLDTVRNQNQQLDEEIREQVINIYLLTRYRCILL